jgi:hypothetical protein
LYQAKYCDQFGLRLICKYIPPISAASVTNWNTKQQFYLEYRLAIAYPHANDRLYPTFASLEQWESHRGTKLQVAVDIIKHLLADDRIDDPIFNTNGDVEYPPLPDHEDDSPRPQTRKILMYAEFPMMSDTFMSVSRCNLSYTIDEFIPFRYSTCLGSRRFQLVARLLHMNVNNKSGNGRMWILVIASCSCQL